MRQEGGDFHKHEIVPAAAAAFVCRVLLSGRLPVFPHVSCDGAADLRAPFVLSKIIHKLSVGSHQVHDDGVIHLKAAAHVSKRDLRRRLRFSDALQPTM